MRTVTLTGANQALGLPANPVIYYRGFSVRETSGTATALIRVWDNASAASGVPLDQISLAANESARELYSPPSVAKTGIFIEVVSGAVAGSIRID